MTKEPQKHLVLNVVNLVLNVVNMYTFKKCVPINTFKHSNYNSKYILINIQECILINIQKCILIKIEFSIKCCLVVRCFLLNMVLYIYGQQKSLQNFYLSQSDREVELEQVR